MAVQLILNILFVSVCSDAFVLVLSVLCHLHAVHVEGGLWRRHVRRQQLLSSMYSVGWVRCTWLEVSASAG